MAFAAIAVLSFSSCSQEEELLVSGNSYDSFNDPNAVMFGTYTSQAPQSRAGVIDTDSLKKYGFGVYAYYTGTEDFAIDVANDSVPNFMCNQQVTWDSTKKYPANDDEDVTAGMWVYSPVKYWPNNMDEKVSFFAYAPYTETAVAEGKSGITSLPNNETSGDPKISYTLSEKPGEQIDLLYSGDKLNLVKQNVDQKVQFNFSHAMSRIGFKRVIEVDEINKDENIKYDDPENNPKYSLADGTTVTITKVSLSSDKFYKSGTLNLRTGKWDGLVQEAQTYTLGESDFTTDGKTATKDNSKTPTQLNATDKYLMIFPTEKEKENEENKIPIDITVEFVVTTTDTSLPGGESKITSQVTSSFEFEFAKGKWYNFVLHIGLTSVKLDAEVHDWNHIWDELINKDQEGEVVVDTPANNSVSLIYDANGGIFLNGSSLYIVTNPIDNNAEDNNAEATFTVRNFRSDEITITKADGDNHEYDMVGWTEEPLTHDDSVESKLDDDGNYTITVYEGGETISVKKEGNTASKTIYAWWPKGETVL